MSYVSMFCDLKIALLSLYVLIYIYIYILITLGTIKIIKSNILYFESLKLNRASLSKSSLIYTLFSSKIHKGTLCIISVIMT